MSNTNPIIVGLDIGTTKIAAIAGRKNEYGKLEILGFGKASSNNSVQHGQVLNIDNAVLAVKEAMAACRQSNPSLNISEVYVGIAGHHIKSLQTRGDLVRQEMEMEISQADVDKLIADQRKTYIPAGDQIIDVIPQEFNVDNFQNIKNPIGYSGVKLGANFHIITGDKYAIRNITRAVNRSELSIKDIVLQPLASADAVMCDHDLEAGVAILDIGGGTSDLAVFHEGILKHTAVIPFGGENITNDIKTGLGVLKSQAEAMKVQFGSALSQEAKANAIITIPGIRGMQPKQVGVKTLSQIIQARMSEILDFVIYHLKQVGMDNKQLNGGIILTGGGSQLKHLLQLTEYQTGLNARIGYPNEHLSSGYIDELTKPMYATCIGLILKGYSDFERKKKEFVTSNAEFSIKVPEQFKAPEVTIVTDEFPEETPVPPATMEGRKSIWDKLKDSIYDIFKEEDDTELK
ncbi:MULTISPECIES: cell division protein FtsA [Phnomibacter]|uniref:Cell division protein FtsA n=1 Tax=Phnomibacter ginsenosidimutans TaxID=2676868 RepID=A0A6I6G9Y1_9BACT|nr:cell division protein FtsA [Phnomibacter ginsenosidimutans]QGW29214.1 cell division protein FtsA [Phnomibacter ginsenosidimutans]